MPFGVDDLYESGYEKGYNQGFKDGKECTLVSIDAIEDIIDRMISIISEMDWEKLLKEVNKRPQGEWIDYSEDEGYVECPICNHLTNCDGNIDELHYCWNCGADMRGES